MKLRDTKIGHWLKDKAPKVLDIVGDALPDKGVLGIVKNLLNTNSIPPEQRLEFEKMEMDFEKEMKQIELQDKTSARWREVEYIKSTGHFDYMMWFLAFSGISIFAYLVWAVVNDKVPTKSENLIYHIFGIVEGIVMSMFAYYFGSSAGSRIKDMKSKSG